MVSVDLQPAANRMAELIRGVPDGMLGAPTPCSRYSLGDLVDHVGGFSLAFTGAANKDSEASAGGPAGDGSRLTDDWRARITRDLSALALAWQQPQAWTGMTRVGGVELPGEVAGLFALDELVIHGWDVARASRQAYTCDQSSLEAVHGLVLGFAAQADAPEGLFGPAVEVAADQPLVDRVVGLTGRSPAW